jgi:hypothetical protein
LKKSKTCISVQAKLCILQIHSSVAANLCKSLVAT